MKIERAMELLKAANPVTDDESHEQPLEASAAYLAGLERRSDGPRSLEDIEAPAGGPNTVRIIAMAVAAAVLVAAIGYGLVNLLGPGNDVIEGGDVDLDDPLTVLPGKWESAYGTFTFTTDLRYSVTEDGTVRETGTYRVIGTLVSLVSDADSAECAGVTDTLDIEVESADRIAVGWEAVGCEAHFVLDCFVPGGGGPDCGRLDRVSD